MIGNFPERMRKIFKKIQRRLLLLLILSLFIFNYPKNEVSQASCFIFQNASSNRHTELEQEYIFIDNLEQIKKAHFVYLLNLILPLILFFKNCPLSTIFLFAPAGKLFFLRC